jgi:hypothetical protein
MTRLSRSPPGTRHGAAASGCPGRRRPSPALRLAGEAPPHSPPPNPRRGGVRLRLLRAPELTLAPPRVWSPAPFRAAETLGRLLPTSNHLLRPRPRPSRAPARAPGAVMVWWGCSRGLGWPWPPAPR